MPSANIQASSITSDGTGGGDSFIPSTPTRSRYSSPPPSISAIKPIHSPPPPPRRKDSIDGSEIITAKVLKEINSGHSILNPKPSVRRPRSRSDSTLSGFMLAASSRLSSLSSGDSDIFYNGGPIRLQMRSTPRRGRSPTPRSPTMKFVPIMPDTPEDHDDEGSQNEVRALDLYPGRSSTPRSPTTVSVPGFVPIEPEDHDDEESQNEVRTLAH